ncbi:hypothetical protein QYM36_014600 [Artemia franciscana]|uniref:Uncharacterized protein n=1 Tax=Artemia franciscana TaxID=6661 RepID=A0AA88HH04_ARTSF|nr:hypothetical protein QYM36_014600 [Artemia franciscana]
MKYQIREDELSHEIVEYFTAKSELTKRNKRAIEHHIATVEELLENGRREDEVCHREKEEMLKKIEELLKNDVELMKEENGLHQGKIKKLIKDTDRTYFFLLVMNLIVIVFIFGLSWWHLKSDRDRAQQANAAETERSRPITSEGLLTFGQWLSCEKWEKFQDAKSSNEKATIFQEALLHNYKACFPEKSTKRFSSDRPYITQEVKKMVMEKRRLFRHGNTQQAKLRKVTRKHANKYVERKVNHLFESKPSQSYNRIKRMRGKVEKGVDFGIDEDDVVTADSLNKHLGSALECYVCNEQEGNTDKCLKTIKICEQHEDMCMTKIKWGSLPYWTITAAKQFNVSKECATKDLCEQTWNATLPYCERIWYLDWRCSECCAGDRCNYYVTVSHFFFYLNL